MNFPPQYAYRNTDPGKHPLPYVKGGRFFLIVLAVILIHLLFIVLPYFILKITDLITPPLTVEKVTLVDHPPADSPSPQTSSTASKAEKNFPQEKLPAIPEFPDIADIPDFPVQNETLKQETKQTAPVQKKSIRKEIRKTTPSPVKKKQRFTRPEEIKISTKRVKTPRNKAVLRKKNSADLRSEKIRNLLADYKRNTSADPAANSNNRSAGTLPHHSGSNNNTSGVSSEKLLSYYEKVRLYLLRSWKQPNTAQLHNRNLQVLLTIHVDASGRILTADITKKSGNPAMDRSVEEMLEKVKVLPVPPKEMTFTVNVNIEQN